MPAAANDRLVNVMRAEYLDLPGLHVTLDEAQRFWKADRPGCELALRDLIDRQFLRRAPNGRVLRLTTDSPGSGAPHARFDDGSLWRR